jgi:hypothetical protein
MYRPSLLISLPVALAMVPSADAGAAPPREVSRRFTPMARSYRNTSGNPL